MARLMVRLAVVIEAENPSSREAAVEALKILLAAPLTGNASEENLLETFVEEVEDWEGEE